MPELPPRLTPWVILTPWRYRTPWTRFIGTACLAAVVINLAFWIFGGWLLYLVIPTDSVIGVLLLIDMGRQFRDHRKFRRTLKALRLWSQIIDGKLRMEDLTPEQQEEIAVQRAMVYTEQKPT